MDEMKALKSVVAICTAGLMMSGCGGKATSFSLLPSAQNFSQSQATINNKIDILWVVDNSGSMDPLQQSLVQNFNNFISKFQSKGFDFNMSVTTSDAYLSEAGYQNNPSLAKVRDGSASNHSGFFFITPLIPNIVSNFVMNTTQGSAGSGDERVFQSMFDAINSPLNSGMFRQGAYFAVIILSDEDDFSDSTRPEYSWLQAGGIPDHDYADTKLIPVSQVVAQLDQITASQTSHRNYNVSAITVLDSACQQAHVGVSPSTIIGQRYIDLVNATGGVLGSICDSSYANSLNFIQQRIVELATEFPLTRQPNPATIQVIVDSVAVAQDSTNGWTYDSTANAIAFHGSGVPSAGAGIQVTFDPLTLNN